MMIDDSHRRNAVERALALGLVLTSLLLTLACGDEESSGAGGRAGAAGGEPGHRGEGLMWRTSPTLALNRARLQHYIETSDAKGHSNRVWFDDMVVSTSRIGCE